MTLINNNLKRLLSWLRGDRVDVVFA